MVDAGGESEVSARRDSRFDLALAAGITVLTQRDVWAQPGVGSAARVAIAALLLMACASLLWRRRHPLVPCVLLAAALATQAAITSVDFSSAGTALAVLVALYSAGAYLQASRAAVGVLVLAIGLAARELGDLDAFQRDPGNEAFWWLLFLSASGLGVAVRHRRRAQHLRVLAGRLQEEGAEQARAAVVEERERIARELHDVVAHGVSAVVVQAEAAEELLASNPDRTRESLWTIQRLGREALNEMRQVLGILRGGSEEQSRDPQPTVADLPMLIARNRDAGLAVRLDVLGPPRALPPGLQVSAYRVVQEGLTNVRKHADGASAVVSVHYRPAALEIEIVDDGPGARPAGGTGGLGLIGMRERVTFFGGEFAAGTRGGSGFAVTATFPTAVAATR
jgi:signal transduction histidine kinase